MDQSDLQELAGRERQGRKPIVVSCCTAAGCLSSNAGAVKDALAASVEKAGLADRVHVAPVGCMRLCCEGPLVQVDPDGPLYENNDPLRS